MLNIGFLYDTHAANIWTLDQCDTDAFTVELQKFTQFAEVQRALQQGDIDVAAMGYQNMAQMIAAGYEDFRVVSGVYTGAEHLITRTGEDIESWADLSGRKVGVPPNSFVEMLFRSAIEEAGVSIDDIELVPFAGAGPPMLTALENGDVDAIVVWEPTAATAVSQGSGIYPTFNIQDGAIGNATSALYVTEDLISNDPDVVDAVVECVQERTEALADDVDDWVSQLVANTGLSEEVARQAISTGEMDIHLYQESAERIIQEFAANGLVEDVSGQVEDYFDYGPLERVTGQAASDLGSK